MVKLEEQKHKTQDKFIEKLPPSSKVYIPLSQHLGEACASLVSPNDAVLLGEKIASIQVHVSAPIHSSVSGKVLAIQEAPHPVLGRAKAIVIENNGQDKSPSHQVTKSPEDAEKITPEQIRNIVFEAGIVGMGGASFPTHIKLNPPKPVDTLIINGAECEPYLTGDYRLMVEKTKEIILGAELVARCLGVKNIYLAIEDNKPEAIKNFNYELRFTSYELRILKSQYPQGGEKQLIKNIVNKEVPSGKLPFELGVVVHNVATVYAIYEAVYLAKPLYERVVTVTGSCLSQPKNLLVRIGSPIKELIAYCGPLKEEPAKIIVGGPMMGIAQYTDEVPVIKSTTGIILMNEREARIQEEEFCIRCGACVRECPAGLMPCLINLAAEKEIWAQAKTYGVMDCIECGLCSYVCPANRNLVQSIKRAKLECAE
ncbi:MAG: electron transport complex subunit RsxC [Candidatus Omnitrophica bacterium]|nr:electron transport complex subunit RsxC [Candidatus Omnitrophota bacterium]MBI5144968.1 electron transport complex subunit RsxC [Candidatus Omnitrophota bacterium]